jgi:hypothetical protein
MFLSEYLRIFLSVHYKYKVSISWSVEGYCIYEFSFTALKTM